MDGAETVESATKRLGGSKQFRTDNVRVNPWPDIKIGGLRLLTEITNTIDSHEIFACDLTHLNLNVTFELGYAIATFKRVYPVVNSSIAGASIRYNRLYYPVLGAAYAEYTNSVDLSDQLLFDEPWKSVDATLLPASRQSAVALPENPSIYFSAPPTKTDAVIRAENAVRHSRFGPYSLFDNPLDNPSPDCLWLYDQLKLRDGAIVHLLSDEHEGSLEHNVRASLIAGLSYGLGKPVLLLAHAPFRPPMDYGQLLTIHATADESRKATERWLSELDEKVPARRRRRSVPGVPQPTVLDLRRLATGEWVAEQEQRRVDSYFVETDAFYKAQQSESTIIVGRRGTGKTATLYALRDYFNSDSRNHVCVVYPVGYEVDGLVRILLSIKDHSERGYMIESLWKFLIYTELAQSLHDVLDERPPYADNSIQENAFLDYWTANEDILAAPFSERLDKVVQSLSSLEPDESALDQRLRISESLHTERIGVLRRQLGDALADRETVAILIDNLDEPWRLGQDVDQISELLWGLLNVSRDITDDLLHEHASQRRINAKLTIFLRSDIFSFLQPHAAEQDKLPIRRLSWNDREQLANVIDLRFESSFENRFTSKQIWKELITEEVSGLPVRDYIFQTLIPRPRDLIFFMNQAITTAVNRSHTRIEEGDIQESRRVYSSYVFKSVLSEDDPSKHKLEAILYEFAGCPNIVTLSEVYRFLEAAEVDETDKEYYLDLLCDIGFLGIQTNTGFRYVSDESERRMTRRVSQSIASRNSEGEETFEVNSAFYYILQIDG